MKKIFFESLLTTVLVFVVMGLLYMFPLNIKVFNPIKELLKDFKYTDLYYSDFLTSREVDTTIVIVNIGRMDREAIALLLERIQMEKPKVIGVDVFFRSKKERGIDSLLKVRLRENNVITPGFIQNNKVITNDSYFEPEMVGYTNFVSNDSLTSTIRYFRPYYELNGEKLASFSVKMATAYDTEVVSKLETRGKEVESIRYYGDHNNFLSVEGSEVLAGANEFSFRNKLVLIGYLGEYIGRRDNLEDLFFTPMNSETIGRSIPDMYGVVIHANILHMILHNQFVKKMNEFILYSLTFLICLMHVIFFVYFFVKQHLWYHLFAKLAQLFSSVLLLLLSLWLYAQYNFMVDNTVLIVGVLLAVDVLYLYESLAAFFFRKYKIKSYFIHDH